MVFIARTPFGVCICVIICLWSVSSIGAEILGQEQVYHVDLVLPELRMAPGT